MNEFFDRRSLEATIRHLNGLSTEELESVVQMAGAVVAVRKEEQLGDTLERLAESPLPVPWEEARRIVEALMFTACICPRDTVKANCPIHGVNRERP